jgi:hypothetical protein
MDESEGPGRRSRLDRSAIDSVAASLKNRRSLVQECGEKLRVARVVKAEEQLPSLVCFKHVFRMAVGAACFPQFSIENIQQCSLLPIGIAGLLHGEAARNCLTNEPDPFFGYKADSRDAAVVSLAGRKGIRIVRKTQALCDLTFCIVIAI